MNQTWVKSLSLHHRRLYPGQPTINVQQIVAAMKLVPEQQKNVFASYAIRNKVEDKNNPEDLANFPQLVNRIYSTYKDLKDSIYVDAYFKLLDADGDGFITHEDLDNHTPELGVNCISQRAFFELTEKLGHEGMKLGKDEFIEIIREYL